MVVYRLTREKYAHDLSGEGARLYGGRWNHPLTACLYTSESRALALLEYSVNTEAITIPDDLVMLSIEVPEDYFMQVKVENLPADWNVSPPPISTQNLGTLILNETDLSVIGVPSSVVPQEWNFLLNPGKMPRGCPVVLQTLPIDFDFRIKL